MATKKKKNCNKKSKENGCTLISDQQNLLFVVCGKSKDFGVYPSVSEVVCPGTKCVPLHDRGTLKQNGGRSEIQ